MTRLADHCRRRPARISARIRQPVQQLRARKQGNQSLKSCGWNFSETNLNETRNLELLSEAYCSVMRQLRTKSRLHEFLQQKCFLADAPGRDLFFGERQESAGRGEMENRIITGDLVIAPGVRETASEDGAVLLDIEQGICFSLNPVGLKIWELLKTHHSVDEIADDLAEDFPVSRSQLLSDVVEFLQSLEAKRLIHRADYAVARQSWLRRIFPWAKERLQLH